MVGLSKNIKVFNIIILACLILYSCKEKDVFDGPELIESSTDDLVINISGFDNVSKISDIAIEGTGSNFQTLDIVYDTTGSNKVLSMKGTSGTWFVGSINFPASKYDTSKKVFPIPETTAAGDVFINMWVYNNNPDDEVRLSIGVEEDEDLDGTISSYNTLTAPSEEDFWKNEIDITWEGWRFLSFPYSSFVAIDPADCKWGGCGGNTIYEPDKIYLLKLMLLTPPGGNTGDIYIDNLTISIGGPLKSEI